MATKTHASPLATAYARSILELATERNVADATGQELSQIAELVESDPSVQTFMASPAVSETHRSHAIAKAFEGRVSELVSNLLGVMSHKGRLGQIRQVAAAYSELLQDQKGIIEVDVTVAEKLSDAQLQEVRMKVSAALKHEVVVHQYIDPSLIGGLLLRVEDRLFDASVKSQLRAVRRQLLSARPH
jgi:F-type H+-transporting ATPase subunit delta